jgi:hypothetical protein
VAKLVKESDGRDTIMTTQPMPVGGSRANGDATTHSSRRHLKDLGGRQGAIVP